MKKQNSKFWRILTNFWTIVIYIAIIFDFLTSNSLNGLLGPIIAIYIAVLAIYAGDKEFGRWHSNNGKRHPGEIFVIIWTILIISIIALDLILAMPYEIPSEIISAYIAVLGILAVTERSKTHYSYKNTKN